MRSKTKGFTGDKEQDRRSYTFSEPVILEMTEELRTLLDNTSMDSQEFTYTLRAKAFILIDTLLVSFFKKPENVSLMKFNMTDSLVSTYLGTYHDWLEQISLFGDEVRVG